MFSKHVFVFMLSKIGISYNRVGGGDWPPSSHTTVRTVRYTAVSIVDVH